MSVEDKYANSISIVYPAALHMHDDVKMPIDFETKFHCTIQFFGEIDEVHFTRKDLEDALSLFEFPEELTVPVTRTALFGTENSFLVLLLDPTELATNQKLVTDYLKEKGLVNPLYKGFPNYRPHVTVREGYTGTRRRLVAPKAVTLGHPVVWWGNN